MTRYRIENHSSQTPFIIEGAKASFFITFISESGVEDPLQYYEVDLDKFVGSTNEEKIQNALMEAVAEHDLQQNGIMGASSE